MIKTAKCKEILNQDCAEIKENKGKVAVSRLRDTFR